MSKEARVREHESQKDRGRTREPPLGSRSTATLIKLPKEAPIAKTNNSSMISGFPEDEADVDHQVMHRKVRWMGQRRD